MQAQPGEISCDEVRGWEERRALFWIWPAKADACTIIGRNETRGGARHLKRFVSSWNIKGFIDLGPSVFGNRLHERTYALLVCVLLADFREK